MKQYLLTLALVAIASYACGTLGYRLQADNSLTAFSSSASLKYGNNLKSQGNSNDNLDKHLQPDDVLDGGYDDFKANLKNNQHICTRICDGKPKLCYYKFIVEHYSSMGPACRNCSGGNITDCRGEQCVTADGIQKAILTINRKLPSPSIQICLGDTIVADIENHLGAETTSIHWHGFKQTGTQYNDGVPKVTQCPINPGTTYRYNFKAEDPGTFFYHSHTGVQRIDGISGSMVVRQPIKDDTFSNLYDFDLPSHIVFVLDWSHLLASEKLPGLTNSIEAPDSYLINGRGRFTGTADIPLTEYVVKPGKRYKFRLIGASGFSCTTIVTFEGHNLTVVYADGAGPVQPTVVDSVVLNSADRFEVILNANQKSNAYRVTVRTDTCIIPVPTQYAILRYEGFSGQPGPPLEAAQPNRVLNPTNTGCDQPSQICMSKLRGTKPAPAQLRDNKRSDVRVMIDFGFYLYSVEELFRTGVYEPFFVPQQDVIAISMINTNISFSFPPSPLLSQYNDIPKSSFCPKECYSSSNNKPCVCTNVIDIPLGSSVDVIVTDQGMHTPMTGLSHPFHLHGYNFYVLEMGIFKNGSREKQLKEINRRLDTGELCAENMPAQKDSLGVPSGGYVVVQFIADNPGFWLMHCHFDYHLESGMGNVFHVGKFSDVPPVPKGFPKCGNYLPPPKML